MKRDLGKFRVQTLPESVFFLDVFDTAKDFQQCRSKIDVNRDLDLVQRGSKSTEQCSMGESDQDPRSPSPIGRLPTRREEPSIFVGRNGE